jgi:hypothetical protein
MKKRPAANAAQLFRPPGSIPLYLHGPPPSGYPPSGFYGIDNPYRNSEVWFYRNILPFINRIYDIGADTTIYTDFGQGEVHYFEPISDSNIFEHEREILNGNDVLRNKKSFFNNYGLSNVNNDKLKITWEAGDVIPNPNGEDVFLGDNVFMKTRRAEDYMNEMGHETVGFASVDVEGHELEVFQGFGDRLKDVCFVQFENGGTTYSAGHKLSEVIECLSDHGFWGFCYLNMYPGTGCGLHGPIPEPVPGGFIPLRWNKNSEDHWAYCNVVCVNKNFLKPGERLVFNYLNEAGSLRSITIEWPQ